MPDPTPPYNDDQLSGDGVSKKDLVNFLQENASYQFLMDHKLKGAVKNVAKTHPKDHLIKAYKEMFEKKEFKGEGDAAAEAAVQAEKQQQAKDELEARTQRLSVSEDKPVEEPRYVKRMSKKGDAKNFPKKGDTAVCFYTGRLADGTVFDTNTTKPKRGKAPVPLRFKVGQGKVIRGWDEGIQTMSIGEKADLIIEPIWAYGKKGVEGKVPPNAELHFEVELVSIE